MPVPDEFVRGVRVVADSGRVVVPRRSSVVPCRKPHLLGGHVHMFLIEDTGMGDEGVIDIAVHPAEVIDRVASVARPAGRHLPDIWLGLELTRRAEVVLNVKAAVVSGNLLAPFLTERGRSSAVGKDDYIALRAHQPVVPAVGPSLTQRPLRSSETDFYRRPFLRRVKLRREQDPCQHIPSIYGLHRPGLGSVLLELRENMTVLVGDPRARLRARVERDYLGREIHALPCGVENLAAVSPVDEERSREVVPQALVSLALDIAFKVSDIDRL